MKKTEEIELPFDITGDTEDEIYDSVVSGMSILHDHFVRDNLRQFAQEKHRHQWYRLLPFPLIGWGDAHRFLDPIRMLAEERLGKSLEDAKVKTAYTCRVKKYLRQLFIIYTDQPIQLREVTKENLSEVVRIACENGDFYDSYDANINEMLAYDDQVRNRIIEQSKNRLKKLS